MILIYQSNADGKYISDTRLSPQIKVIDWPEELAPSILDDSTFTATLQFKMKGPDTLEVDFFKWDTDTHSSGYLPKADWELFNKQINKHTPIK